MIIQPFVVAVVATLVAGDGGGVSMVRHYDTLVVGCGAAGVAAASKLAGAGRRVLAVDAQPYIGGRVRTVPFGDGLVELGAEWIHGTHPSKVYDLAMQHNVSLTPQHLDFRVYRSDGSQADMELLDELMMYCLQVIETPPEKVQPLGQFVTGKLTEYLSVHHPEVLADKDFMSNFLKFMNLLLNNYEASNDWNDVTAWSKYEDLDGEQHMSWHRYGYKTLFDILLNTHNNGPGLPTLEIKLNTEVTRIVWPQEPAENVTVECSDGTVYTADNVIFTASVGVLKERKDTLFSPSLPQEKQLAIDHISMGLVDKIIITFEHAWWPKDVMFFAFVWRTEEWQTLGDQDWETQVFGASCPMGASNSLTFWTSGEVAKKIETLPEDVVRRKTMNILRRFMGANLTIPEPTGIIRSKWYTNQYTRGSYTYDNLEIDKYPNLREQLAAPLVDRTGKPRVLFAGEATNELHFATVNGAVETGYREAMRLLPTASKI